VNKAASVAELWTSWEKYFKSAYVFGAPIPGSGHRKGRRVPEKVCNIARQLLLKRWLLRTT